jgi:hypothetical protein
MTISDTEFAAANRRGAKTRDAYPAVIAVRYDIPTGRLVIAMASGMELVIDPQRLQGLEHAAASDFSCTEISPSGHGIHFPKLDADVHIPSLMHGRLGTARWMAQQARQPK